MVSQLMLLPEEMIAYLELYPVSLLSKHTDADLKRI